MDIKVRVFYDGEEIKSDDLENLIINNATVDRIVNEEFEKNNSKKDSDYLEIG